MLRKQFGCNRIIKNTITGVCYFLIQSCVTLNLKTFTYVNKLFLLLSNNCFGLGIYRNKFL